VSLTCTFFSLLSSIKIQNGDWIEHVTANFSFDVPFHLPMLFRLEKLHIIKKADGPESINQEWDN